MACPDLPGGTVFSSHMLKLDPLDYYSGGYFFRVAGGPQEQHSHRDIAKLGLGGAGPVQGWLRWSVVACAPRGQGGAEAPTDGLKD